MPIPQTRPLQESREALNSWLARRLPGAREVSVSDLVVPRIGYSAETLIFDLSWRDDTGPHHRRLVARVRPASYSFFPDVDLELHYRMLRALEKTAVPAPTALCYAPADDSPFDEPMFVMEFIDGEVPSEYPPYTVGGWIAEATEAEQRQVYLSAIAEIARIHSLDWRAMELSFLPSLSDGSPGMDTEVERFERYMQWVLDGRSEPLLADSLRRLKRTRPPDRRLCLNWGDPKFSNIVYREMAAVGLLDWELATVAPPEADVVFWLVYHDLITRVQGFPSLPGFPSETEAVEYYESLTGERLSDLGWHRAWQAFRLAVMSLRLTDLLVARDVIDASDDRAPHVATMRLLQETLEA